MFSQAHSQDEKLRIRERRTFSWTHAIARMLGSAGQPNAGAHVKLVDLKQIRLSNLTCAECKGGDHNQLKKENAMCIVSIPTHKSFLIILLSGFLVGVFGMSEPTLSATDSSSATDQEHPTATPNAPAGSKKEHEGKRNHPLRKACAEDAKKLCPEVKAGEGRIVQCLKQHTQDLSQGCADMMQRRHKQPH